MKLAEIYHKYRSDPNPIEAQVKLDHGTVELFADHYRDQWAFMFYAIRHDSQTASSDLVLSKKVPKLEFDSKLGFSNRQVRKFFKSFADHLRKHTYDEALDIIRGLDEHDDVRGFVEEFMKA